MSDHVGWAALSCSAFIGSCSILTQLLRSSTRYLAFPSSLVPFTVPSRGTDLPFPRSPFSRCSEVRSNLLLLQSFYFLGCSLAFPSKNKKENKSGKVLLHVLSTQAVKINQKNLYLELNRFTTYNRERDNIALMHPYWSNVKEHFGSINLHHRTTAQCSVPSLVVSVQFLFHPYFSF